MGLKDIKDDDLKEIKWEDIKAKSNADKDHFTNLSSIYGKEFISDKIKSKTLTLSPTEAHKAFIDELQSFTKEGQSIGDYRLYKQIIEELSLIDDRDFLFKRLLLTPIQFKELLDQVMDDLKEVMAQVNEERFEKAIELMKDDKGFEQLEQLQIEAHKAMEVKALEAAVEDKKALTTNKINLLEVYKDMKENEE